MHAPHAALLIDFDNVTLGIQKDLTKELRTLLNSDIIKGKVAVQRAYADWRRYPQYIVPLSESSIDLIFAPAFGSSKKNATDIRLAIDAIELVFTRPEIGTFILLSGDSDFSTMVIKLKEYGKYVIGVGIRESASDLLIQNCDEYYSYSDLAGLTKEVDTPSIQRDPWELAAEAVAQMARNGDVMRSDRLKQVMQQIDPNFDERNAGFNRFSKFVVEAGQRGVLQLNKLENGQYEVGPGSVVPAVAAAPAPRPRPAAEAAREGREDGGRRGRGRRGRGGRDRGAAAHRARRLEGPREDMAQRAARTDGGLTLARAFQLMTQALAEFRSPVGQEALRLRMVAMHGREDPLLDIARFPRLLRQANDAEVADVRKVGDDDYEITAQRAVGLPLMPPAASPEEPPAGAASAEGGAEVVTGGSRD
ncbi:MAG TPA: NYN domain-containing protein, partial [Gemmatimonadales bacterium]|nr:NYN domain-containing protein [Gemmatimonadales bacterium]